MLGATRNLFCPSVLLQMKRTTPWIMKMILEEDSVNIGEPFSRHEMKDRDIINMKIFYDLSNMHLTTSAGLLIKPSLTTSLPLRKIPLLALMEFPTAFTDVLVAWVRSSSFMLMKLYWREVPFLDCFAESRTIFIPKSSDIDDNGRIIRSPDALRPLTLCNYDCKLLTSAICRGLHWYTMRRIHPSQRCISYRQMSDNIFEIETTALAHVACTPQESGVL